MIGISHLPFLATSSTVLMMSILPTKALTSLCDECKELICQLFDNKIYIDSESGSKKLLLPYNRLDRHCNLCLLLSIGSRFIFKSQELYIKQGPALLPQNDSGLALTCMVPSQNGEQREESIRVIARLTSEAFINGDVAGTLLDNTGSSESFKLVGGWFRNCQQHHAECKQTLEGNALEDGLILPTRVLYVGDASAKFVRVVETRNSSGRWAALSHCWGDRRPICTTRDNLKRHQEGIPLAELPRTFRDAVTIARSLGIDYLWIDTLCIVQQDPEDWAREAPKMGQVYEHAEIVIAAAGASNSYEGCFVNLLKKEFVELPYIKNGLVVGRFLAFKENPILHKNRFRPLSDRAWTIQERVLSRRTIYYTATVIWWNCRRFGITCIRHDGTSFEDVQLTPRKQSWTKLLTQYLDCALSIPMDNLQAIEGIASRMAPRRLDKYYFGCWMNELPAQLIWYGNTSRIPELTDRPSWSWSSTAMGRRKFLDMSITGLQTNYCSPFKPFSINSLLVRCPVYAPVVLAKPKRLSHGLKMEQNYLIDFESNGHPELIHRGDMFKDEADEIPDDLLYLISSNQDRVVGVAIMDDVSWPEKKTSMSSELYLVLLASTPNWKWRRTRDVTTDQMSIYYGLLALRPRGEENSYCRIGLAVIYSRAYVEQADPQDIILV